MEWQRGNGDDKHGTDTVPDRDVRVLDASYEALVGIAVLCQCSTVRTVSKSRTSDVLSITVMIIIMIIIIIIIVVGQVNFF